MTTPATHKRWSKEEAKKLRNLIVSECASHAEAADALGRPIYSIADKARRMGLGAKGVDHVTRQDREAKAKLENSCRNLLEALVREHPQVMQALDAPVLRRVL